MARQYEHPVEVMDMDHIKTNGCWLCNFFPATFSGEVKYRVGIELDFRGRQWSSTKQKRGIQKISLLFH